MGIIDGNWVDICSAVSAIIYAFWHRHKIKSPKPFICKATAIDFASGLSLFPLFLMFAGPFASGAVTALLSSNKLILAIAAAVALFAILED